MPNPLLFNTPCKTRRGLQGEISVPADKSITHRAIILASIAEGTSTIHAENLGRDNLATWRVMSQLGVNIQGMLPEKTLKLARDEGLEKIQAMAYRPAGTEACDLTIHGRGILSLQASQKELNCGNSGTTARLLSGLLAAYPFASHFNGDASLIRRPFRRIMEPLTQMGAKFSGASLPYTVQGAALGGIDFTSQHASAQVKGAILLAGLQAYGNVVVTEPVQSRDHTERMLQAMGCVLLEKAKEKGIWQVSLPPKEERTPLSPQQFTIPGDFSSATFFLVAASILPDSHVKICNVGFNPTRIGAYHILRHMGADIIIGNRRSVAGEDVVDLVVRTSTLTGVKITPEDVVLAIDEIPALSVAALFAKGETMIDGARELRVKESDRLSMIASLIENFSGKVEEFEDGLLISGSPSLMGSKNRPRDTHDLKTGKETSPWRRSGDHRIAMSGAIAELAICGGFAMQDLPAVETSFPTFIECFRKLTG